MINKIVLFLVRRRLHIKKWQKFRFKNQRSKSDYYYFNNDKIVKVICNDKRINRPLRLPSGVSLNWLLNNECKIIKIK